MGHIFEQLEQESKVTAQMAQLVANVARLRSPIEGCLWFRAQSLQSMRRYLLEEVYEVLDPLDSESPAKLQEELGDLLFQIIVLTQLASERSWFSPADVLSQLNEKIIHRSPHVFGDVHVNTIEEAQQIWRERKALEKKRYENTVASPLDGLSASMPGLALAQAYLGRCGVSDTNWNLPYLSLKYDLETWLLSNPDGLEDSLGRLLFMLVDLASRYHLDAEAALQKINAQFRKQVSEQFRPAPQKDKDESDPGSFPKRRSN